MIEWAVAHLSHVQQFFKGLYPNAHVSYGVNGTVWVKRHDLAEGEHVCVMLTPDSEVWVVVDTRLTIRVRPGKTEPLRNGRYATQRGQEDERWEAYADRDFANVIAELAHSNRSGIL
jgi:hypothetical protein